MVKMDDLPSPQPAPYPIITDHGDSDKTNGALPSPELVGREFVRQYYTILNKAPTHLHRFYSHDSVFMHGVAKADGQLNEVVGQTEIQKKIEELQFKDCCAKIRSVCSLKTLGEGVVVQVCGELSNNGSESYRRFCQTFVLAPQTPKKFYVHNDVFQYLDAVFSDDDHSTGRPESEATTVNDHSLTKSYSPPVDIESNYPPTVEAVPPFERYTARDEIHQGASADWNSKDTDRSSSAGDEVPGGEPITLTDIQRSENEPPEDDSTKGPKSWAERITKGASGGSAAMSQTQVVVIPPQPPQGGYPLLPSGPGGGRPVRYPNQQGQPNAVSPRGMYPSGSGSVGSRPPGTQGAEFALDLRQYPDDMQLFVGNLPRDVADEELFHLFSNYGRVMGIRVHRSNKEQQAPLIGFVAFDSDEPVKNLMNAVKGSGYRELNLRGQRLNIERKRAEGKDRPRYNTNYDVGGGAMGPRGSPGPGGPQMRGRGGYGRGRGGGGGGNPRGGGRGGGGGGPAR